jgi:uncharacterized membrane protein HdeD (DUF308 family)
VEEDMMLRLMARNWWVIVLRGVCAILFGVLAWTWPGVTLGALVLLWGAYAFIDGVLALVSAFSGASGQPWWVLALEGLVGLGAAAAAVMYPGITALVLLYMIAAWAIVTGVFEIAAAIRLRKEIEGEVWLGLAGLASVLFGLLLVAQPGTGALAVVWIIGTYAILFGTLLVALGFRLKGLRDRLGYPATAH